MYLIKGFGRASLGFRFESANRVGSGSGIATIYFDKLHSLINLNHIPTFQIDGKHKCDTCVEVKMTRSSFESVERHIEPLDIIYSDICDLKFIQTRGGNKYLLPLVMIAQSTVICAYSKVRMM